MQDPASTYERIVGAAEGLFAERGLLGVTLRELTAKAGVNLAAVHYHHGGLEAVYQEALRRSLRALQAARISALAAEESLANGRPVPLATLGDLLARPLLQVSPSSSVRSLAMRRLVGRLLTEPHPIHDRLIQEELEPSLTRFAQAFRRHVPTWSPSDFVWTYSFLIGALHHCAATLHEMGERTRGVCANNDVDSALRNFRQLVLRAFENRTH